MKLNSRQRFQPLQQGDFGIIISPFKQMVFMKKIVLALLLVTGFLFSNETKAQTKVKYYYYPAENIYYNTTSKQYGYAGENDTWLWVTTLPTSTAIADTNRYVVLYSPNDQIWKQNAMHKMKYKDGKLKKVKIKNEDDR
jgi:hypothetical protein